MKRTVILMLGLVVSAGLLVGCGNSGDTKSKEVKGKVYDSGKISMLVPEGWNKYKADEGANIVTVVKGAAESTVHPKITVQFSENHIVDIEKIKSMYDDVVDAETLNLGENTWVGFTGNSFGYAMASYVSIAGKNSLQITILFENMMGEKLNFKDADVQAIIESIKTVAK